MLSHVMVGSNDLQRSKRFYDALLAVLGAGGAVHNVANSGHERLFYRHDGSTFAVTQPIDGEPAQCGNGHTVGFRCESPEQVDAFHRAALSAGGTSIEDPPGMRQSGTGSIYLAYVRDPDGNKLCAIHRPAT